MISMMMMIIVMNYLFDYYCLLCCFLWCTLCSLSLLLVLLFLHFPPSLLLFLHNSHLFMFFFRLCEQLVGHLSHSWKKKTSVIAAQQELNLLEHSVISVSNKMGLKTEDNWEGVGADYGFVSGSV